MTTPIGDPRPAGEKGPAGDQRAAGEAGPAGDPRPAGAATVEATESSRPSFDPAAHTAQEVNAYLAGVGEAERQRVLDAEKSGKARVSITG